MQIGDKVIVSKATIQDLTRLNIPKAAIDKMLTGTVGRVTKMDSCTVTVKFRELEGIQTYQFFRKYIEEI